MRNLKKLLAVIVAICVLATFTVPAFAETKTDAEIATELGVIKGTGDGVTAEYLATQPDRLQGAIMLLRLMGLEDEAKAFTGTDNFSDVEGLNDTNKAIVAYLKAHPELGYGDGIGGGKFGPTLKMEAKQYYKIMLVALGYTYGTDDTADFTWANVMSFAASKGLVKMADVTKFTVNDLCKATVEALKATVKGGTTALIAELVADGNIAADVAASTGLFVAADVALTVVSATANNLISAKIVFNKEIDATTVTKANFSNAAVTVNDPQLLDDKKTVLVIFDAAKAQNATADIVVENVKALDGTTVAKVTRTVTFIDLIQPEITGAVAKNAKTIEIQASEPINFPRPTYQVLSNVKIDGVNTIAKTSFNYVKNVLTLSLTSNMAVGAHKIDISDLKDFSGLVAVSKSFNFEVAADTTAPAIASATVKNVRAIEVIFTEDVDVAYQGSFWVNGSSYGATQDATDKSKFTINLTSDLNIAALVEVKVEYQNQKDVVGNAVSTKTAYTFKVEDDTNLPTVTATIGSDNKITLNFSKSMYATGTIKVLKASDKSQMGATTAVGTGTFKLNTNNTVIEYTNAALTGINPTDIIVNIKDMKDGTVRANVLAEQNIAIKTNDTLAPTVDNSYVVTPNTSDLADDTVTFYFSEAMDTATLNNLSNYVVNTTSTGLSATPGALAAQGASIKEITADGKSVVITYKGISAHPNATFTVYALKDAVGNMLTTNLNVAKYVGATMTINGSAVATGSKTVEISFNTPVNSFDPSVFSLANADGSAKAVFVDYSLDAARTKATLISADDFGTTTAGLKLKYENVSLATDVYGKTLTGAGLIAITDKVAPTVAIDAGTTAGSIVLTFSEDVDVASLANLNNAITIAKTADANSIVDLTVTPSAIVFYNADGTIATTASFVKVVISSGAGIAVGTDYTVTVSARYITDAAGNNNVITATSKSITTAAN